ncbi:hypothetical protein [Sphingomonas sp.]|uniref:DoxX family protein n=1 Tax=Sphingomonas sp. TaxID=28214 RepID=UPI002605CB36|nr:hypothetical protein [Sphingomonas sp.]
MDGESGGRRVARWLLIAFYLAAGIGHLLFIEAMMRIVPAFVPAPRLVVLATGLAELAGAAALVTPRYRRAAGRGLAAYALCVWPANMQHAWNDLSSGTGLPIGYHVVRLLLQPLIIWWALWASGAVRSWRQP